MQFITDISQLDTATKHFSSHEEYSVEFFHIYSDENISERHIKSLEYLGELQITWSFPYSRIVLIDDYNPDEKIIGVEEIIAYLDANSMHPDYFAYESDLINNANILLESIRDAKTYRSYTKYIQHHNKYPCSLLTASWYLTRLGYLDSTTVIRTTHKSDNPYTASKRLINILPDYYQPIEKLANQLILKSSYSAASDRIEDLFYSVDH